MHTAPIVHPSLTAPTSASMNPSARPFIPQSLPPQHPPATSLPSSPPLLESHSSISNASFLQSQVLELHRLLSQSMQSPRTEFNIRLLFLEEDLSRLSSQVQSLSQRLQASSTNSRPPQSRCSTSELFFPAPTCIHCYPQSSTLSSTHHASRRQYPPSRSRANSE